MSLGTLFSTEQIRSLPPKALIKHFNLDVKLEKEDESYKKHFPLGKIPGFIGPKGFKLHEVIAISIYCMYLPIILHAIEQLFTWWEIFSYLYSYPCLNTLCREYYSENN